MLKKTLIFVSVLVVVVVAVYGVLKYTKSQSVFVFGGRVLSSVPCPCSGNFLLTISGPAGGQFTYYPGTQAYANYNLGAQSGMWALGLYEPGGVCLVPSGKGCSPLPSAVVGTITPTVGSSLIF